VDPNASRLTTTWLLALVGLLAAASAGATDVVIHAGRLIDGASKVERRQVSILIHDDRITAVENGFVSAPAGARVINLADKTVLPGLIDCHDHITSTWRSSDSVRDMVTRSDEDDAIEATVSARNTLLAGFTSIRDVGASTHVIVALKRAMNTGVIEGPRMWVAGPVLGPTGGHGDDANGLNPEVRNPHWLESIVDGAEEARRTVRRLRREGVDLIKIAPSGGVMSIGDDPALQLMEDDEMKAVIDTAHSLRMKVAAHAHGKQAIDHAVTLGVDSIEHGSYADQASYALMTAKGVYLVPTLLVGSEGLKRADAHPEEFDPSTLQKGRAVVPMLSRNLHDAYKAGVKIAFGTDTFGLSRHGDNAREFALMVGAGMSPIDAIWAATHNAAELIGSAGDIGAVAPGHYADIIAVNGDPLLDIRVLEQVDFVMQGGRIVKVDGKPL
jgi:imidazolonepropionase-like amidohydrolase